MPRWSGFVLKVLGLGVAALFTSCRITPGLPGQSQNSARLNSRIEFVNFNEDNSDLIINPPRPEEKFKTLLLLQESKNNIFKYYFYLNDYEIRRVWIPAQTLAGIDARLPASYNYYLVIKGRYQHFWVTDREEKTGEDRGVVEDRYPNRRFFIGFQEVGEKFVPSFKIFLKVPAPDPTPPVRLADEEVVKNIKPQPGRLSIKVW